MSETVAFSSLREGDVESLRDQASLTGIVLCTSEILVACLSVMEDDELLAYDVTGSLLGTTVIVDGAISTIGVISLAIGIDVVVGALYLFGRGLPF